MASQPIRNASLLVAPSRRPVKAGKALSSFLGRVEELAELARLLERSRLITLTGAPGIGKTLLARALAERHGEPTALVELASIGDPALVHRALASALSVREVSGQRLEETVVAHLRERRLLLVLDNCEHLIGTCAELVDSLLGGCTELAIVATSREPLRLTAERVWSVGPLPVPDRAEGPRPETLMSYPAVCLFLERAVAVAPGFVLNSYVAPAVAEICRRLDGIPLAIELAAARVGTLTPAEIARRLDDRFGLLTQRSPGGLPGQPSLLGALDWSYELLSPAERALLRRVSIFVGGFGVEAAETICADRDIEASEVPKLLAALVSKSLVGVDAGSTSARYRLLETIRAYASDRLEQAGEVTGLRRAHAGFYLALAEKAEPELTGAGQKPWLERLEAERANLRSALEWSLSHGASEVALRLAGALVLFWRLRCHFSEGRDLLYAAVAASNGEAAGWRAKGLWGAGLLTLMVGDPEGAIPLLEESLACFRGLGDLKGSARALLILGNCKQYCDNPSVLPLVEQSATLAREAGDTWCLTVSLAVAGFEHAGRNELPAARPLFEECVAVARESNWVCAWGLIGLGKVAVRQGHYRLAESSLEEAAAVARDRGDDYTKATALEYLAELAFGRGDYCRTRELVEQAMAMMPELGPPEVVPRPLVLLAWIARAEGDPRGARRLFMEVRSRAGAATYAVALQGIAELAVEEGDLNAGRRLFEEARDAARLIGDKRAVALAAQGLGRLAQAADQAQRAAALYDEALELQFDIGDAPAVAGSLEALAGLSGAAGRHEHAVGLFGAAAALRERGGYQRPPWQSGRYEADVALARENLSPEQFAAAFAEGAALSVKQAAARASKVQARRGRPSKGWSSLTGAERPIAQLVAEGLTNRQIAERLDVTPATVKTHLSHIFAKLGVASRSELGAQVWYRRQQQSAADSESPRGSRNVALPT